MVYPVTQLVAQSFYLSQVVTRQLQTVEGEQFTDGIFLLNSLLGFQSSNLYLIPYFTRSSFLTVIGEGKYFIPNLVSLETLTFNIGPVQFPMKRISREDYFGTGKIDNVNALPFSYHTERALGGMDIYLYFKPGQVLLMKYTGKFSLSQVTAITDLSIYYDLFYIEYLRYALAEYICSEWAVEMPVQAAKKLAQIVKQLKAVSPPDLKMNKASTLQQGTVGITWAQLNLSPGWTPVG